MQKFERADFEVQEFNESENYAKFVLSPLERGFGTTIGNALRRVLLSSLPGAAVFSIKVDGVYHEFTTIPGVREDVSMIILKLKQLIMKIEDDEVYTLQISAKGPCVVTAGDIICPAQVEILNKDLEIAHLEVGTSLEMELKAKNGRGYVSADINKQQNVGSSQGIGTVYTDSIYTPIEKVAYTVDPARVGQDVKYDALTMEIMTDGSITPQKALAMAARILIDHLDLIAGLPYENYESFVRSFNRVYAMKPDQLQLGFLKVLKGSLMHEKAREYSLIYQERPPYEVLSTKWLSYGDIVCLKKVEEMVEVYYNSAQFKHTLAHLEQEFPSPFAMYEAFALYYEAEGLSKISHSRLARYEIIYRFIRERQVKNTEEYREWLTLDLYLRDNVKNRPDFLGESRVSREEAAAFYKKEAEEFRYLKGYESFDRNQIRKMTHLERIKGRLLLFDYRNRDRLTNDAAVYCVDDSGGAGS